MKNIPYFRTKIDRMDNFNWESIKLKFQKNKNFKLGGYIFGGALVLVLGIFVYRQFVWVPSDVKANDGWWSALNYIEKDSTDQAIKLLVPFVNKYDGHDGGEIGQFLLATQYMKKGEFRKALDNLEDVDVSDTYVAVMAIGLQGDCLSELKKYDEAAEMYEEAADEEENEFTSPMYLWKAGLNAEKAKKLELATEYYTKIRDDYPAYASQKTIEKYIARTSSVKKK